MTDPPRQRLLAVTLALGLAVMLQAALAVRAAGPAAASSEVPPVLRVPVLDLHLDDAREAVLDRGRGLLYVTLGPGASAPDSVAAVDLATWRVVRTAPAGVGPRRIAIADDGSRLYVGADGENAVTELALPELSLVRKIPLPAFGILGPTVAADLAVVPGRAGSVAVARKTAAPGGASVGLAVYDDGVERPVSISELYTIGEEIEFGPDPTRVYVASGAAVTVAADGVRITGQLSAPGVVAYDGGLLFGDDGAVLDAVTGAVRGRVPRRPASPPIAMAPAAADGVVWFAERESGARGGLFLRSWSTSTFAPAGEYALDTRVLTDAFPTSVDRLLRVGPDRLVALASGHLLLAEPGRRRGAFGEYVPLTPSRILDTRIGLGRPAGAVGSGETVDVVVSGEGGVPGEGVLAVVLNATVTGPTGSGFLTVWPAGTERPVISSLNFRPGDTVANLVTVGVSAGGAVSIYNLTGTVHVVFDVVGYYSTADGPAGGRFRAVVPSRLFDTRLAGAAVVNGETRRAVAAGRAGLPATGAIAVALTVTAVDPTEPGYLTVHPGDVPTPVASTLNFPAGRTVANLVVVRLPPSGEIDVFHFGGRTDVIADVVGYYDEDRTDEHGRFSPAVPVRVLDSRTSGGVISTGGKMTPNLPFGMTYGIQPEPSATAYVFNVTVTEPEDTGFATLYPSSGFRPLTSNVNFSTGQTVANAAMVAGPGVGVYPNVVTHMVIDLFGAFT